MKKVRPTHSANASAKRINLATKQVDILMLSERPYIGIEAIGFADLEVGKALRIEMIIKNAGRTPAKKVRAPGKISIEPFMKQPAAERIESRFLGDGMLAANTPRTNVYETDAPYDLVTARRVAIGALKIFIQGTIWYEDAWGNEWDDTFFLEWDDRKKAFLDRREKKAGEHEQQKAKQPPADS